MGRQRADLLLVARGLFDSRAKAQAAIAAGGVFADGKPVAKASETLDEAAEIRAEAAHPWVGRGALKLDHAFGLWPIPVEGRIGLDVGASTGGFTEVLLSKGISHVYAVDVGHGQLHTKIGSDARVTDLSGLDARNLTAALIPQAPGLVVSDVSFIALAKALPAALALAAPGADLVALIKPQFELGREHIGKGGLVKDPAARRQAVDGVLAFLTASGWTVQAETESPILGGEGAVEHLVWARKPD
ncbi:MAG: TlyA family rRNA (cytidine-2'-O)-methyltransferase [Caulobacterales bacterium 68-7]|nr:TlyA family RNA methyltransferase [Caulobacterales bacterium]OJU09239.1 MAG: TlyA family rRNA (cytidine-2'-O)-methyltransferase [Caulobacterales bacterium 68-7]